MIAHIDLDAFYAQCEQVRLGLTKKDPVVCRQWNGLIAISYAARKFGISRHENALDARKKCPSIVFAHVATFKKGETEWKYHDNPRKETHKVSLDPFRRESRKIFAVFKEFCGVLEKASIDETYFDLGAIVYKKVVEMFPELNVEGLKSSDLLPDPPKLVDFKERYEWTGCVIGSAEDKQLGEKVGTELYDFLTAKEGEETSETSETPGTPGTTGATGATGATETTETAGTPQISKTPRQTTETPHTTETTDEERPQIDPSLEINDWDDVCLLIASNYIKEIRKAVFSRLDYTCSAGIARNRILAKLASAKYKPACQTVVRSSAIPQFLDMFELSDIGGLGGKLGEAIKEKLDIPDQGSIKYLRGIPRDKMLHRLSPVLAKRIENILAGEEALPVNTRTDIKSMMATKNFTFDPIPTSEDAKEWLKVFAAELEGRILELSESKDHITMYPKTMTLTFKSKSSSSAHNKQIPFPSQVTPERLRTTLFDQGCNLLLQIEADLGASTNYPCLLLALGSSNFQNNASLLKGNRTLSSFFQPVAESKTLNANEKKSPSNQDVLESSRLAKPDILSTASDDRELFLSGAVSPKQEQVQEQKQGQEQEEPNEQQQYEDDEEEESDLFVTKLPEGLLSASTLQCEKCRKEITLEGLNEHRDFHFAQDLCKSETGAANNATGTKQKPTTTLLPLERLPRQNLSLSREPPKEVKRGLTIAQMSALGSKRKKQKKTSQIDKNQTYLKF